MIIICFIYNPFGGDAWGTPTEGGALGAFVVFCMALIKGMRWPQLKDALLETAKLSVMIFTIIWGVLIYVRFLSFADLPGAFFDWITTLDQSPMLTLVFILLAYAVLGMFMDQLSMMLLTVPIFFPLANTLGFDLIWFGVIVLLALEISFTTPPFGLLLFVMKGVSSPGTTMRDIYVAAMPFMACAILLVFLLILFPGIALWLPSLGS